VNLEPVGSAALLATSHRAESSAQVLDRVVAARAAAAARWEGLGFAVNARAPGSLLRRPPFRLPARATDTLAKLLDRGLLSARGHDRVLRVAWTIVDINGQSTPDAGDIDEALELRTGVA
jgi:magnesium chelatase family protein